MLVELISVIYTFQIFVSFSAAILLSFAFLTSITKFNYFLSDRALEPFIEKKKEYISLNYSNRLLIDSKCKLLFTLKTMKRNHDCLKNERFANIQITANYRNRSAFQKKKKQYLTQQKQDKTDKLLVYLKIFEKLIILCVLYDKKRIKQNCGLDISSYLHFSGFVHIF